MQSRQLTQLPPPPRDVGPPPRPKGPPSRPRTSPPRRPQAKRAPVPRTGPHNAASKRRAAPPPIPPRGKKNIQQKPLTPYGKLNQIRIKKDNYHDELLSDVRRTLQQVIKQQGGWTRLSRSHQRSIQQIASVFFTHAYQTEQIRTKLHDCVEAIDDGFWILLFRSCQLKAALRKVLELHPVALIKTRLLVLNMKADMRHERIASQRQREEYVRKLREFKIVVNEIRKESDQLREERDHYKTLLEGSRDASRLARAEAQCAAQEREKRVLTERVAMISAERDTYLRECDTLLVECDQLEKTSRAQAESLQAVKAEKAALLSKRADLCGQSPKGKSASTPGRHKKTEKQKHKSRHSSRKTSPGLSSKALPPPPPLPRGDDDAPSPLPTEFFKVEKRSRKVKGKSPANAMDMQQVGS